MGESGNASLVVESFSVLPFFLKMRALHSTFYIIAIYVSASEIPYLAHIMVVLVSQTVLYE